MKRREFCSGMAALAACGAPWLRALAEDEKNLAARQFALDVAAIDGARIVRDARKYMAEAPRTITASHSDRTPGGLHDYFSEGDYWWPDPKHPDGPYIRRDGLSNPGNFVAHREALLRLSVMVPALAAAWKLTGDRKYAARVRQHAVAWFVDRASRMNPNLEFAQAIHGITTGRGTGIIDTIHLVEVTRALRATDNAGVWKRNEREAIDEWFRDYVLWMTESKNGREERDAKNNHGSCWVMQVAAFARFTGDRENMRFCADRFRTKLVPEQVAPDGSLPLELERTKPYSYSLFNMDILSSICQILSGDGEDLWAFETADGRSMRRVIAWMAPFIADKKAWPKAADVEYFDDLPVRQPSLLFGGIAYRQTGWIDLWKRLNPDPATTEIVRNFPIRQPVLWVG